MNGTVSLADCQIMFHTNHDDKDDNTHITITLKDPNGDVAARMDDDFGYFDENTDHGPYRVDLDNDGGAFLAGKAGPVIDGGDLTIRIDPSGDDNWEFNVSLTLTFSDGKKLSGKIPGIQMDQDNRVQNWPLSDFIRNVEG